MRSFVLNRWQGLIKCTQINSYYFEYFCFRLLVCLLAFAKLGCVEWQEGVPLWGYIRCMKFKKNMENTIMIKPCQKSLSCEKKDARLMQLDERTNEWSSKQTMAKLRGLIFELKFKRWANVGNRSFPFPVCLWLSISLFHTLETVQLHVIWWNLCVFSASSTRLIFFPHGIGFCSVCAYTRLNE